MFIGIPGLSLISNALRRGGGAFDPLSLEPVWMADFADTDTMYLTSAGTTKVASDGNTVGMLLEVSQWGGDEYTAIVAAQPNLLSNGDFATGDFTNWTQQGGDPCAVVAEKATASSETMRRYQDASVTANGFYELTGAMSVTLLGFSVRLMAWENGFSTELARFEASLGANAARMIAKPSLTTLRTYFFCQNASSYTIDDIALRRVPGAHQQQTTTAARPKWYSPNILRCDGTDDALPGLPAPSASGTIALKMSATTANRVAIGCQNATPNRCYLGTDSSGQLAGAIGSDGFATIHGSTDIVTSPVTGVAILTWDATGGVQLYWEGAEVYTGSLSGSIPTATTMTLGGLNNNGTPASYFAGDVIGTPIVLDSYANAATAAQLTTYLS